MKVRSGWLRVFIVQGITLSLVLQTGWVNAVRSETRSSIHPAVRTLKLQSSGKLVVSAKKLKFPAIGLGGAQVKDLTLQNNGDGPLEVNVGMVTTPFRVFSGSGKSTLAPGQMRTITIEFAPVAEGAAADTLVITSDDPDRPSAKVKLKGVGKRTPLRLSKVSAKPGETLAVLGEAFDPNAPTSVVFVDQDGNQTRVPAESVTPTTLTVAIPPFLDLRQFRLGSGTVSVLVAQGSPGKLTGFGPADNFQIGELPQTGLKPGLVTLTVLEQLQLLLESAARNWRIIQDASSGSVDSALANNSLITTKDKLLATQTIFERLVDGEIERADVGELSGRAIFVDISSLALIDRLLVAYLFEGQVPVPSTGRFGPQSSDPFSLLRSIADQFRELLGKTIPEEILEFAKKYRKALGVLLAVATVGLIAIGAGVEIPLAAYAVMGAMVWCIFTWVPAVIAVCLQGGTAQVLDEKVGISDFSKTITFLRESLTEAGIETATHLAGERLSELGQIATVILSKAVDIRELSDLTVPSSLASAVVARIATIRAALLDLVVWQVGGSVTVAGASGGFGGSGRLPRVGGSFSFGAGPAIIRVTVSGGYFFISGAGFGTGECFCKDFKEGIAFCGGGGAGGSGIAESPTALSAAGSIGGRLRCTCSCDGRLDTYPIAGSFAAAALK